MVSLSFFLLLLIRYNPQRNRANTSFLSSYRSTYAGTKPYGINFKLMTHIVYAFADIDKATGAV